MTSGDDQFSKYFTGHRADPVAQPEVMQRIFALRYDVYCRECRYLPEASYPEGLESDAADTVSGHFYATDQSSQLVGYVRLVPADAEGAFPFDHHGLVTDEGAQRPDPRLAGEISRLMVHSAYRRRRGDTIVGVTLPDAEQPEGALPVGELPKVEKRSNSPQIMLNMFRKMYSFSVQNGVRYWYAAMERPLAVALMRMGFAFRRIGDEKNYYGPVAPYLADLRELERKVGATNPQMLAWIQSDLRSN